MIPLRQLFNVNIHDFIIFRQRSLARSFTAIRHQAEMIYHLTWIPTSEHIFPSRTESNQEAVGRLTIICEILSKISLRKPSVIAKPSTAAENPALSHCRLPESYRCNLRNRDTFCTQRTMYLQKIAIGRYRQR